MSKREPLLLSDEFKEEKIYKNSKNQAGVTLILPPSAFMKATGFTEEECRKMSDANIGYSQAVSERVADEALKRWKKEPELAEVVIEAPLLHNSQNKLIVKAIKQNKYRIVGQDGDHYNTRITVNIKSPDLAQKSFNKKVASKLREDCESAGIKFTED